MLSYFIDRLSKTEYIVNMETKKRSGEPRLQFKPFKQKKWEG